MHNVSSVLWRRTLEKIYITSKVIRQGLTNHFVFNLCSLHQWVMSRWDKCGFNLNKNAREKIPEPIFGLS